MKVYTCTEFKGFFPVGTSAVVVAPDADSAASLLAHELQHQGLRGEVDGKPLAAHHMKHLNTGIATAIVLQNGDY